MKEKTHWLQNPNKNYLGHPDLPSGADVILTIKAASQEEVENPCVLVDKKPIREIKRVITFVENYKWLKPFICNQVNSEMIIKVTGEKFMEDCIGKRIKLGISKTEMYSKSSKSMESIDCLRIRNVPQKDLQDKTIEENQIANINELLGHTDKSAADICNAYGIGALKDLPASKYAGVIKTLNKMMQVSNGDN
jgi:hypothetical protein